MEPIERINRSQLPKTYNNGGNKCYLDPIREKLIQVTPEETVRQHVISYLINDLKVPKHMIRVEERLDKFKGVKSNRRADIIILGYDKKSESNIPITVIECKAPDVYFTEKEINQMWYYADKLGSSFCALINDSDILAQVFDYELNEYQNIVELPSYKDMLGLKYEIAPVPEQYKRLKFNEIPENCRAYQGFDTGWDTPEEILIPAVNLIECLSYTEHKLPVKKYGMFELIEDYGTRLLKYGNNSGDGINIVYRSFLIKYKRKTEFVSIGFSSYVTRGNNLVRTCLCVAVDNEKMSHHALEMVLDDNVIVDGKKVTFMHHGRIGVSNIGSGKVADLRKLISKKYPSIVDGTRFNLGTLTCNRLWNLDDPEVMTLIENLISYALLRDEYREKLIREKK